MCGVIAVGPPILRLRRLSGTGLGSCAHRIGDDATSFQKHDPITDRQPMKIVAYQSDSPAPGSLFDHCLVDPATTFLVQPGCRFVQDQRRGVLG